MDLVKLDKQLPLRAYPDADLNRVLIADFSPWLGGLLSLTDETSLERLEIALPAIKDACIGMGFHEIKRMFEMYADGKMNVKPIPNYFDRILFGKIISEYKALNKKKIQQPKTPKMSENDRKKLFHRVIKEEFKSYKATGELNPMRNWIYDDLARFDVGITMALKKASWRIAQEDMKAEQSQYPVKDRLTESEFNAQSITRAKANLIATIFDKFTTFEQLKSKLNE